MLLNPDRIMPAQVGVLEKSRYSFLDSANTFKPKNTPNPPALRTSQSTKSLVAAARRNFEQGPRWPPSGDDAGNNTPTTKTKPNGKPKKRPAKLILDKDLPPLPDYIRGGGPRSAGIVQSLNPPSPLFSAKPKSAKSLNPNENRTKSALELNLVGSSTAGAGVSQPPTQTSIVRQATLVCLQPSSPKSLQQKQQQSTSEKSSSGLKDQACATSISVAPLTPTTRTGEQDTEMVNCAIQSPHLLGTDTANSATIANETSNHNTTENTQGCDQNTDTESMVPGSGSGSTPNSQEPPCSEALQQNDQLHQKPENSSEGGNTDMTPEASQFFTPKSGSRSDQTTASAASPGALSSIQNSPALDVCDNDDKNGHPVIAPRVDSLPPVQSDMNRSCSGKTTDTSTTAQSDDSMQLFLSHQGHRHNVSSSCSSMCSVDAIEGMLRLEVASAVHLCRADDQPRITQKFSLIRELVDTERTFASDMAVLMDIYYGSLGTKEYFGYISRTDVLKLFSNVDQSLALARQFSIQLQQAIPSYVFESKKFAKNLLLADVETRVADVFLEFLPAIRAAFQAYCDTNQTQMDTFYRIRTLACPKLDQWLNECFERSKPLTSAWTLDSLLIKPVQRLLKYPLLLAGLVKCTPQGHPDYEPLQRALYVMKQTAETINENTAKMQNKQAHMRSLSTSVGAGLGLGTGSGTGTGTTTTAGTATAKASTAIAPGELRKGNKRRRSVQLVASDYLEDAHVDKLLNLRNDCNADEILQEQMKTFQSKKRQLQKLIQAATDDIASTQQHFNNNSVLAKTWLSWMATTASSSSSQDELQDPTAQFDGSTQIAAKTKKYRHYALFTSPFTSQSNTQLSTSHLSKRIKREVLRPLDKVRAMWERTEVIMNERRQFHKAYSRYVNMKSDYSYAIPRNNIMPPEELRQADTFVKYHNSLKDGLPDLFRLTDRMIGLAMAKYVGVQKEWFRVAVDSMASVFDFDARQVCQKDQGAAIVEPFKTQSVSSRESVAQLGLFRDKIASSDGSDAQKQAHKPSSLTPVESKATSMTSTGTSKSSKKPSEIHSRQVSEAPIAENEYDETIDGEGYLLEVKPTNASAQSQATATERPSRRKLYRKSSLLSLSTWQKSIRHNPSRLASN